MEGIEIYLHGLEEFYRTWKVKEQVGETKVVCERVGRLIEKIRLINKLDNTICDHSEELCALVNEAIEEVEELGRRYDIL